MPFSLEVDSSALARLNRRSNQNGALSSSRRSGRPLAGPAA